MQIKKFPKVAVVATKLNFLQCTYRFKINHKTLYSQTFQVPILAHGLYNIFLFGNLETHYIYIYHAVKLKKNNKTISFRKINLNISSGKGQPFWSLCLYHNVLTDSGRENRADILQTTISNLFISMKIAYANVKQIRIYIYHAVCKIEAILLQQQCVSTLMTRKYGRHFPDDNMKIVVYSHCA